MSNEHDQPTNRDENRDNRDDRVDEIARGAGATLRRPAPVDGMDRVRAGRRRQRTTQALMGASAAALIAVGVFVVVDRGSDNAGVLVPAGTSTVATTPDATTPPTSEPGAESTVDDSTPTSTTTTTTTEPATTVPALFSSGWQPATEPLPALAGIACCGSNLEGEPSPPILSDTGAPLPAGTYDVSVVSGGFTDDVITIAIRPYVRCSELTGIGTCEGTEPYPDNVVGVPDEAARTIDLVLDDSIGVDLFGFACVRGDQQELLIDRRLGTGTDFKALATEVDAAYRTAIEPPLRAGVDPEQIVTDLGAYPTAGFSDPGCDVWTNIVSTPSSGPAILLQFISSLDDSSVSQPLVSAPASWIRPTALGVDDAGRFTLYFYAGFLS